MLNQCILVGRLKEILQDMVILAVPRSYKNEDGVYDTDIIPVKLIGDLYTNTLEYCKVNDLIGVKGVLMTEGTNLIVRADKITFLSSNNINSEGGE